MTWKLTATKREYGNNSNVGRRVSRRIIAGGLAGVALAGVPKAPPSRSPLEKLVMLNGTAPPEPASHDFQYAL